MISISRWTRHLRYSIVSRCLLLSAVPYLPALSHVLAPRLGQCMKVSVQAKAYSIVDLGTLGGPTSTAYGLNVLGQVVGWSETRSGARRAFLYMGHMMRALALPSDYTGGPAFDINRYGDIVGNGNNYAFIERRGTVRSLGTLGGGSSTAQSLNDRGQVVGESYTRDGNIHPFLYIGGILRDLGTLPGYTDSLANGINAGGDIVGVAMIRQARQTRAFLYSKGILHDLGTLAVGLPGARSGAIGINVAGQVVGYSDMPSGNEHAFLYQNRVMRDLGTLPGYPTSIATAINNTQEIVGTVERGPVGPSRAFIFIGGAMRDLNSLLPARSGWILESSARISDAGQIIGQGMIHGQEHAFLMTLQRL